ncbi:hypothetical protein DPMN_088100 [Dreissena polymorpha]|uniref:Uncharacterized protein n=1 Tax=Dreissena polymorpha TaxID=45954 RepID=A0A9D4KTX3_DREPO|nr:hypothetical protein DPMN_088100 [Dreissena polymorpha]
MLLEQHIAARAGILLLEQHLNAARPVNFCSSSNMLPEQHLNAARAAFFSARAEVKVSTPLVRHSFQSDRDRPQPVQSRSYAALLYSLCSGNSFKGSSHSALVLSTFRT